MNTSPPLPKEGGQNRERQKLGEEGCTFGRRCANRSTSTLAQFFWIDNGGEAPLQRQQEMLPWRLSLAHPPDPVSNDGNSVEVAMRLFE